MIRFSVACALAMWVGLTLLLASTSWGSRLPLADRLRPHAPGNPSRRGSGLLSVQSARASFGPLATSVGGQLARWAGIHEDLETRLLRVHHRADATEFRLRQVGVAGAALMVSTAAGLVLPIPVPLAAAMLVLAPAAAFFAIEHQLGSASRDWQRRLFLESPVISEQLAMHLAAGASLANALARVTERGSGATVVDLRNVLIRIRQGLSETDALAEWERVAKCPPVSRLVTVLSLHGSATDLHRIVGDEAKALRRDVHRELIAAIERKNQQVWIPVTVSALIPGVIVLSVPFLSALRTFAS